MIDKTKHSRNVLIEKSFSKDKITERFLIERGFDLKYSNHLFSKKNKNSWINLFSEDFNNNIIYVYLGTNNATKRIVLKNCKQTIRNLENLDYFYYLYNNFETHC